MAFGQNIWAFLLRFPANICLHVKECTAIGISGGGRREGRLKMRVGQLEEGVFGSLLADGAHATLKPLLEAHPIK